MADSIARTVASCPGLALKITIMTCGVVIGRDPDVISGAIGVAQLN
jgi:hypothetical protein